MDGEEAQCKEELWEVRLAHGASHLRSTGTYKVPTRCWTFVLSTKKNGRAPDLEELENASDVRES